MTIFQKNNKLPDLAYRSKSFFFFLIGAILVVSYQNSLTGIFIFDDLPNITDNTLIHITSLTYQEIEKVFSPNQICNNRIIANLSFALNYYQGQLNPVGYHFINILIHITNAWLLFYLFQWYLSRIPPPSSWNPVILSGIAALWWATNPIQTNAVTYIVQRMTSLSTMFCLISLLFYLKARVQTEDDSKASLSHEKTLLYFASGISWIFAMLSKEIAAIFPILIIVHEIYFFDIYTRFRAKPKKYCILLLILSCLLTVEVLFQGQSFLQRILQGYGHRNFTLLERLLTEPRVVFHYISLFLYPLPTRLRIYYDTYPISYDLWSPPVTAIAFAGILLWLFSIIFFFKRNKLISFGLLWMFLCLLIESTIIPLELVFEHRFYLPSIGFVLALMAAALWLLQQTTIRPIFFYSFIGILLCSQVAGTYTRNREWSDALTFYTRAVEKKPASIRALTDFGVFLLKNKLPTLAAPPLKKALAEDPDNIIILVNLYAIYMDPPYNNQKIAESYLQKIFDSINSGAAIPSDNRAIFRLAYHLFHIKKYKESLILLEQIGKYTVVSAEVFLHIGQCHLQLGQLDSAITALEHAHQLETDNHEIIFHLALSYKEENNPGAANKILADLSIDDVQDKTLKNNIIELLNSLHTTSAEHRK